MLCQEKVRVNDRLGLHLRLAAEIVKISSKFKSRISVACGPNCVDGKSLIALLTLAASCGTDLVLFADGDDAHQALHAVKTFFNNV